MNSDEKDRTLRWFHMDHLIREYLFSTLLNLKANISSFLYFHWNSGCFNYMSVMKLDCREHNLFIFFILQKHIVLLWLYSKVHLHLVILQTLLSKVTYNWGIHKAINLEDANKSLGHCSNKYKLAREWEKDEDIEKGKVFFMKSSSVERDEFSVVAWRLTGIQHSGWGWEDHSSSQE